MWNEEKLDDLLTTPSDTLISDMGNIKGDILILGAGGKMGPSLAVLAKRARDVSGTGGRVIAVSRFTDPVVVDLLKRWDVEIVSADLLKPRVLDSLPDAPNVIFMAGRKFGTDGQEPLTWAMNAALPLLVAQRYRTSSIVAFSSGIIYPMVPVASGGVTVAVKPDPIGEYANSVLGRERMFEYGAAEYGTKVFLYRLNYAVDLRYGVLYDIAINLWEGRPISLDMPAFNCIWQGTANEIAIRALLHTASPAVKMNVTGLDTIFVKDVAIQLGRLLDREPEFAGEASETMLLSNASETMALFNPPTVSYETLLEWQAQWILEGGRALGKPTHFEQRRGSF